MSDRISNRPIQGTYTAKSDTPQQSFDIKNSILQKPSIHNHVVQKQEAVDYSAIPVSASVKNASTFDFSEKEISQLVHQALSQTQMPRPSGLEQKTELNDFQKAIAITAEQNGYPKPVAFR